MCWYNHFKAGPPFALSASTYIANLSTVGTLLVRQRKTMSYATGLRFTTVGNIYICSYIMLRTVSNMYGYTYHNSVQFKL
jgi:hypothetical protein